MDPAISSFQAGRHGSTRFRARDMKGGASAARLSLAEDAHHALMGMPAPRDEILHHQSRTAAAARNMQLWDVASNAAKAVSGGQLCGRMVSVQLHFARETKNRRRTSSPYRMWDQRMYLQMLQRKGALRGGGNWPQQAGLQGIRLLLPAWKISNPTLTRALAHLSTICAQGLVHFFASRGL